MSTSLWLAGCGGQHASPQVHASLKQTTEGSPAALRRATDGDAAIANRTDPLTARGASPRVEPLAASGVPFRFLPGQHYPMGALSGELVSVVSTDIDGDRRDDIIMASRFNGTTDMGKPTRFLVVRQSASGTLLPVVELPYPRRWWTTSDLRTAVGDVDGDGRNDVVMGSDNGILVLGHRPATGFAITEANAGAQCAHIVLVDIDLDARLDAACLGSDHLWFLLGDGAGRFTASTSIQLLGTGWVDLKTADANGDGLDDLLVLRDYDAAELLVFPHDGESGFAAPISHPMPPNADGPPYGIDLSSWGMASGDFNGDGLDDLVASTTQRLPALAHVVYQRHDAGSGFLNRELALPELASAFVVADFDRDGDDDIFVRFPGGAITHAAFIEQDEGRLIVGDRFTSAPSMSPYYSNATAVGDVNRDGCPDVVAVDGYNLWVNASEGCFLRETGGRGVRRRR